MAQVYLGRLTGEEGFEKIVAIKVIHPRFRDERRFRELFAREARIAASLSHPNLIQVFDFGRVGSSYYLAMEYVDGWNLAQALARARMLAVPVPPPVWRYWMEGILNGIGHLHGKGIVHRDVSPSNVLLSKGGAVKVSDLGIARSLGQEERGDASPAGKFAYMSPEQGRGEEGGPGSDLFAAALIGAEMFLPGPVFAGNSKEAVLSRLARHAPDGIELPGAPGPIVRAVRKGLANRREERFADAEEFLSAVRDAVPAALERHELASYWEILFPEAGEEETVVDGFPRGGRDDLVRERRERYGDKRRVVQGALAALLALSAGGWAVWRGQRSGAADPVAAPAPASARAPSTPTARSTESEVSVSAPSPPQAIPTSGTESAREDKPPARTLRLETDPPGVSVSFDGGTSIGTTPLSIDASGAAGKEIVFERKGYLRRKVRAETVTGQKVFRLEMEPETGTVDVIQAIPWGKVYLDDKYLGETPIPSVTLPAGKHRLRVVNEPLGADRTMTIDVRPGPNARIIIPLVEKQ
jgi:serine/threonine-protein kinase